MSNTEVLNQLLDKGRKIHRQLDALKPSHAEQAALIRTRLNELCDRALTIYFHEDKNQAEFQKVLQEVERLLEQSQSEQLVA